MIGRIASGLMMLAAALPSVFLYWLLEGRAWPFERVPRDSVLGGLRGTLRSVLRDLDLWDMRLILWLVVSILLFTLAQWLATRVSPHPD